MALIALTLYNVTRAPMTFGHPYSAGFTEAVSEKAAKLCSNLGLSVSVMRALTMH